MRHFIKGALHRLGLCTEMRQKIAGDQRQRAALPCVDPGFGRTEFVLRGAGAAALRPAYAGKDSITGRFAHGATLTERQTD